MKEIFDDKRHLTNLNLRVRNVEITRPIWTNLKQQHSNKNWRISALEKGVGLQREEDEANNYAFFIILWLDIIVFFSLSLSIHH